MPLTSVTRLDLKQIALQTWRPRQAFQENTAVLHLALVLHNGKLSA